MANVGDKSAVRSRATRICVCLAVIVAADQITKSLMVNVLQDRVPQHLDLFGSRVGFSLARNSGAAFSRLQGYTPILAIGAVVIAIVLARTLKKSNDLATTIGLVMVLGGACGNLADRFFRAPGFLRGHVIDFVQVGSFPLFNVADSCITIGAILIAVRSFMVGDPDPQHNDDSRPKPEANEQAVGRDANNNRTDTVVGIGEP